MNSLIVPPVARVVLPCSVNERLRSAGQFKGGVSGTPARLSRRMQKGSARRTYRRARGFPLTPKPPLVRPCHAQPSAILDDASALPQDDGRPRPAFAGSAVGGERNLIVLDTGHMLHDAFAVRGPRIDAEGEVS